MVPSKSEISRAVFTEDYISILKGLSGHLNEIDVVFMNFFDIILVSVRQIDLCHIFTYLLDLYLL